jgi:preprotein translocase subunit SecB
LQLNSQATVIEEGVYEVVITLTVTAKLAETNKVMFLVEAKQAGIFQARNIPATEIDMVLAVVCPNILYPYAREVVSDITMRAGFAPVLLNPINFEALYQQQKEQAETPPITH